MLTLVHDTTIPVPRAHLEHEVSRRLKAHPVGKPGMSVGTATGDGIAEVVYRDEHGEPVGLMGFCVDQVTDFAVARHRRRQGIATKLLAYLRARGVTRVRGPFTEDGTAFIKKASTA